MRFDLTAQPWVPVVVRGARTEVSVRQALLQAHEIEGLAVEDPLQAVAVFRQVLLPVVLHAFDAPGDLDEWGERFRVGRFDAATLTAYLDEHADRFDLFDPVRPFAQVAQLQAVNGETKPVSLLIPQLAAGNNVPLFSARTENDPPALTPAEAARAVLSTHCWDTAAIKTGAAGDQRVKAGITTGNPTGPLGQLGVVVPMGQSLFETLMLSVPVLPQGLAKSDRPQWAKPVLNQSWDTRGPEGLLDLLTWQSRRIRLVADPDATAEEPRVRRVVLCAGDRISVLPLDVEPHTVWKLVDKPKANDPPRRPDRHQPGRSAWRGLAALVATQQPTSDRKSAPLAMAHIRGLRVEGLLADDFPLHALIVGVVYGNQSAVIEDVVSDVLPLPMRALLDHQDNEVRSTLLNVVDQAEQLRVAANQLGNDLRAAAGVDKMPWDRGQRLGEVLIHAFTPTVHRLLSGLQQHPRDAERAELAWRIVARRLALDIAAPALEAAPPIAFLGREPKTRSGRETNKEPLESKAGKRHPQRLAAAEATFLRRVKEILGPADLLETA